MGKESNLAQSEFSSCMSGLHDKLTHWTGSSKTEVNENSQEIKKSFFLIQIQK